jgi:hypothetical protein
MHCCTVFKWALESKGQRGIAVVARRMPKLGLFFELEFRAVAHEDEGRLASTGTVKLMLSVRQAIKFCPWCGTQLLSFYGNKLESLTVYDWEG